MKAYLSLLALVLLTAGCLDKKVEEVANSPSEPGVQYVDAPQAAELLKSEEITVIDVRTPEEFGGGHLDGALNIDYKQSDFAERIAALDPGNAYLVHCAVGGRSTAALEAFEAAGMKRVYHLDGGYNGWKAAGLDAKP